MKRLLLLFTLMLCFCLHTQAKERTVTYKIKAGTSTATIICKGNFDKGILSDGPVKFYSPYIADNGGIRVILEGTYLNSVFTGTIKCREVTLKCTGEIYNNEDHTVLAKSSANDWTIKLQFTEIIGFDLPVVSALLRDHSFYSKTIKNRRGSISREVDLSWIKFLYYFNREFISSESVLPIQNAIIKFNNGNIYTGPIYRERDTWKVGKFGINYNIWNSPKPFKIQYKWSNEDEFEGDAYCFRNRADHIIPVNGIMRYHDGSIDSMWTIRRSAQQDYSSLFTSMTTPSQLRDKIRALEAQQREKELMAQREAQEKEALRKKEQLRERQEQQAEAQKREQTLIRKYGTRWGKALATGKLELGMTKQMCQEVIDIKSYDIGKHNYAGHIIETWTFNKDKQDLQVAAAMSKLSGEEAVALAMFIGLAETFGATAPQYTILTFTDGKLTSIY